MKFPRARLLVFCKAPVPGRVKTRLIPLLGPQGAARLQAALLDDCLARTSAAGLCPVELHCAPDTQHEQFVRLCRQYRVNTVAQSGSDLGERMAQALQVTLAHADAALLIGADCPGLRGADLELALAQLNAGADVVLGPALDGGYYLIGMRRPLPELFMSMPWGTAGVFALTRQRAVDQGLTVSCLPQYRDIDTADDYLAWRSECPDSAVVQQLTLPVPSAAKWRSKGL